MDLVLTLVSAPDKARLDPAKLAGIAAALTRAGAKVAGPDWLDPGFACDLAFAGLGATSAQNIALAMLGGDAVELRCFLAYDGKPVSETWLYRLDNT